jgi:hypothetical protein
VAGQASTIAHALHSNLGLVAKHGRASLAPHQYRTATPRHVRQRAGTGGGAIDEYVVHHNINPKPFIWIKSVSDILQKVICANSRLDPKHRMQHYTRQGVHRTEVRLLVNAKVFPGPFLSRTFCRNAFSLPPVNP